MVVIVSSNPLHPASSADYAGISLFEIRYSAYSYVFPLPVFFSFLLTNT